QYGFINTCVRSLIITRFGQETWEQLRQEAGVQDTFLTYEVYEDDVTARLVAAACRILGVNADAVLHLLGEHFFEFCKRSGYDHMLRSLGGSLFQFIQNLDALHGYLSLSYKEMKAPSFRVEMGGDGSMLLHYYSERRGLGHIVPGERRRCAQEEWMHGLMVTEVVGWFSGKLLRGFEPVYPDQLCIDLKTFCNTFPFHLVFDEELKVRQAGVNIQRIVPGLQVVGIQLDHYFTILHPEVTFTIGSIRTFINSHFVLQTRRDVMPSLQCMFYQASPLLRSLLELEERSMHLSDIAPHDATRDLILLNQQRLAEMELSSQLERKKEELRLLSQHLEEEKQKTETLLYTMLPKHVANQLKEGKKVEAGEFKESTILFSDVVTFTNICSACEPIQIVFMLNSMYLKFDRLTTVHSIYKVETIGDAYMVVGGVPVPVSSHAERVANFALGMIIAAKEVTNPVTGGPIQIRVGMHSGPVLAGVVGEKMPRYCLFGDTVNTASRMESHGRPDKIHLSPTSRCPAALLRALEGKGFVVKERGELEVKGKGRMFTYFLEGNLASTEDQIMGRPARDARCK
uniref:guanylate cyclase n=1 Tax=Denticeps clupeoides TaxID=299321 RepID=A0AAY4B3R9_9TELE